MYFFVEDCFHWIGFHMVNHFLENGWHVDGMDDLDTDEKEHLSMFLGRNDLFHHVAKSGHNKSYDASISIGECEMILKKKEAITIKLPLVFGEWMPMNQDGACIQNDFIRFDSQRFISSAVHVENIIESVKQWIRASGLPQVVNARSIHDRKADDLKLENTVYIRNNRPIKEEIENVKKHYERYKKFYPRM
ncbi:hypothetical protein GCM10007063_17330 [Lentibacillus kapialis]|uniref:Uncharacterized protein n=1 Tax=Lentibacillus kapialis TaxID=340214 RepID=A0A917PWN9_9BACI|nr:hypothetical protein [Lentibacillus kapialis]GGJ95342.1 hypothetical protein GCM10007063_17330 [Lentibacillus kapialis]